MADLLTKDFISAFAKRALDILFIQNPKGSAMGVLFGFLLHGLTLILSPTLNKLTAVDFNNLSVFYYVFFGMFVFNLRLFFKGRGLPQEIENQLNIISRARKEGDMDELEAKIEYRKLIQKVLEEVTIKDTKPTKPRRRSQPVQPKLDE
jgi:hypothetical protein